AIREGSRRHEDSRSEELAAGHPVVVGLTQHDACLKRAWGDTLGDELLDATRSYVVERLDLLGEESALALQDVLWRRNLPQARFACEHARQRLDVGIEAPDAADLDATAFVVEEDQGREPAHAQLAGQGDIALEQFVAARRIGGCHHGLAVETKTVDEVGQYGRVSDVAVESEDGLTSPPQEAQGELRILFAED